jgi:hypothetical protein
MHVNIPAAKDSRATKFWRKFGWLVIGAFAPEWVAWMSIDQWIAARYSVKKMRELRHDDWTKIQAFYLNMGGFVFKARDETTKTLDPPRFRWLIEHKHLEWPESNKRPPAWYVTEDDIKDKSKADGFAKLLALLQTSWLIIQCIARGANHLPLSTLEITTIAYVTCMLFSYVFWWNKPYGVAVAKMVDLDHLSDAELDEMKTLVPEQDDFTSKIGNMFGSERREDDGGSTKWIVILAITFGAIHLAAWNFVFPTLVEQIMWRVCACITAATPFLLYLMIFFITSLELSEERDKILTEVATYSFVCLYIVSRTFLIVEVFLGLRALPSGVYETWDLANYFFHFF